MGRFCQDRRKKSFYFFIFISAVPIMGALLVFLYSYSYIKKDIDFKSHELKGLGVIAQIQKSVFALQKLRGLNCIETPNEESLKNMDALKMDVVKQMNALQATLLKINKEIPLKKEIYDLAQQIKILEFENYDFHQFSQTIETLLALSKHVSYHSDLVFEQDLKSFLLVRNVVFIIPELIEYNGLIRAATVSFSNGAIATNQEQQLSTLLEKIEDKLKELDFNSFMLKNSDSEYEKIKATSAHVKEAQYEITKFAVQSILNPEGVKLEPNGVFKEVTKNLDFIVEMHEADFVVLQERLRDELKKSELYKMLAVVFLVVCVGFVLMINRVFYVKNREYIDKIEELTITDPMTMLYNRRYFDEIFESNLRLQQRTGQPLGFIIFDIDFFKLYNDTYGHQAGDHTLKSVAGCTQKSLKRATDMAFRLGGEEFGILCLGVDEKQILSFAQQIRENIEALNIEHKSSAVKSCVSVSMGVVVASKEDKKSSTEIYKLADDALYEAKERGRNRVVLFSKSSLSC